MKKSILFIIAVLSVMLTACKNTAELAPVLEITAQKVDFTYQANDGGVIEFNTSSELVSAESDAEWCRPVIRRKTVVVRVDENTEIEARTANVTIVNKDNLSVVVKVSQKGVKYAFEGEDQTIDAKGGNIVMPYFAEDKMVVVLPEDADWVSAEVSASSVLFTVEPNDAITARTATVSYAIASKSASFTITQEANAPYVTFTPALEDITIPSAAAEKSYAYATNATVEFNTEFDWITLSAKDGELVVRVDMNNSLKAREGSFTYKLVEADETKTVKVAQDAAETVIVHFDLVDAEGAAVTEVKAGCDADEFEFTVKTNAPWEAAVDKDFVTVTPASDENADFAEKTIKVKFAVTANTLGEDRTATITFSPTETAASFESVIVTLTQDKLIAIALEATDVKYNEVTWTSTPSADDFTYLVDMMPKATVDAMSDAELFASEIETYEYLGSMYSMTLEEVLEILSYVGPDGTTYDELDPETEYTLYAFAYEMVDGTPTLIGKTSRLDVKTKEDPFKFYGTAVWHDVFVSTIFNMEGSTIDMPCDVYTDATQPGKYFFKSPYNYANIASWFDSTPEEMKQYTGNWKDVMLELDATNASKVKMAVQELGVSMSSTYGWISGGMYYGAPSYDNYGTLSENTFTFVGDGSTKYVYWSMAKYSNGALKVNKLAENFTVKMTQGGNPVYPSAVKVAPAGKRAVSRPAAAKLPAKSMKKDFHIMAVPVQY